ncbi:hypothetical protein CRG98_003057 [Punica granatum]|uniref:Uncharacterized protein n=1 Tax=Punica granatum TaxID=22663 RepID=A0A2I0L8Q2_PUNGR|nr:hypothetical protein CRG98_003057 [Punica granatum]
MPYHVVRGRNDNTVANVLIRFEHADNVVSTLLILLFVKFFLTPNDLKHVQQETKWIAVPSHGGTGISTPAGGHTPRGVPRQLGQGPPTPLYILVIGGRAVGAL